MSFSIRKASNGYILEIAKGGLIGGFQKPEQLVYSGIDECLGEVRRRVLG